MNYFRQEKYLRDHGPCRCRQRHQLRRGSTLRESMITKPLVLTASDWTRLASGQDRPGNPEQYCAQVLIVRCGNRQYKE
jgi:hypothetical protein